VCAPFPPLTPLTLSCKKILISERLKKKLDFKIKKKYSFYLFLTFQIFYVLCEYEMNKSYSYSKAFPFMMWALPVLFFSYMFALRIWPGMMINEILKQLQINTSKFGLINSAYYYGYGGMQIPVAILLDRWGPRRTITALVVLCGLSNLVFSCTSNWMVAALCRFLVGVGSAVGFLGVSKVISQWFAKKEYSRMLGLSVAIGVMGAIYGGSLFPTLVESFSIQSVSFCVSGVALVIALGVYVALRFQPPYAQKEEPFKISHLKTVLCSPILWLLGSANLLLSGSLEGFADVWGVPYLIKGYGISTESATYLASSCIFLGLIFGSPLTPLLGKKIGDYTVTLLCGAGIVLSFLWLLLSGVPYNFTLFMAWFLFIGLCSSYQVNLLSAGNELVQASLSGITIAFLNSMNMFGGCFFHPIIGYIDTNHVKKETVESMQSALLVIPLAAIVGTLVVTFVLIKWHAAIKAKKVFIKTHI
jgi:MFS family permease